ncbi:MAG: aldo/keto reductase [Acidobacteriota bacterium]
MNRRDFVKSATLATGGLAAIHLDAQPSPAPAPGPGIKAYRPLGKTGFSVSDLCLGGGNLGSPATVIRAVELGINYIDSAPDYGNSHKIIGEAFLKLGKEKRKQVFILSKICDHVPYPGHYPETVSKETCLASLEKSLRLLNTDYVDAWMIHALGERKGDEQARLNAPGYWAAIEEAKKRGMVRFVAASSHGPNAKIALLNKAIDTGKIDIIMPAYSFLGREGGGTLQEVDAVIAKAKAAGIGVIAMKTVARASEAEKAQLQSMAKDAGGVSYMHLCLRWVLQNPGVSGIVKTLSTPMEVEEYVKSSGQKLATLDQERLQQYAAHLSPRTCRIGCGDCHDACPYGVEINVLMRLGSYFEDYHRERYAMSRYAQEMGREQVASCQGCSAPCMRRCPYGVDVKAQLTRFDRILRLGAGSDHDGADRTLA